VNLPLIGAVQVTPVPAAAPAATLLAADNPDEMKPIVDLLTQTRKSLTLRSLFMTGFPHDPEFFAAGVALARQWSRQGLKIAVVDLDYRNPTVARPRPYANEGYVDALEYGCSFQRIAWELVSDSLWMVGPGSHPPDERRFADHPDWARVMRIFSARVDLTLYMAPFLDRKGFTGSLSKRMDGVVLAACVRRSSRTALRDAFLELWGSDAPMIGCIGIDVPYDPIPRGEVQLPAESSWPAATSENAPSAAAPSAQTPPTPTPPAMGPIAPEPSEWTFPSPEAPVPRHAPAAVRRDTASASARTPPGGRASVRDTGELAPQSLVARLSDEVRRGQVPRAAPPRSRGFLLAALALTLAGAGAIVTYQVMHRDAARATAPAETLPAGTERVLPADLGSPAAGTPAVDGSGGAAPQGTGTAAGGQEIATPGAGEEGSKPPETGETAPGTEDAAPGALDVAPRSGSAEKTPPPPPPATSRAARTAPPPATSCRSATWRAAPPWPGAVNTGAGRPERARHAAHSLKSCHPGIVSFCYPP